MSTLFEQKQHSLGMIELHGLIEDTENEYILDLEPGDPGPVWRIPREALEIVADSDAIYVADDGTEHRFAQVRVRADARVIRMEAVELRAALHKHVASRSFLPTSKSTKMRGYKVVYYCLEPGHSSRPLEAWDMAAHRAEHNGNPFRFKRCKVYNP